MLQHAERVLGEYQALVLKMHADKNSNNYAMKNFELLCDLHTLFVMHLPYDECFGLLLKFNQDWKSFIGDTIVARKVCQFEFYAWYADPQCAYWYSRTSAITSLSM